MLSHDISVHGILAIITMICTSGDKTHVGTECTGHVRYTETSKNQLHRKVMIVCCTLLLWFEADTFYTVLPS